MSSRFKSFLFSLARLWSSKSESDPDLMVSDPQSSVSEHASQKTKELWQLHGLADSDRFPDPKLDSLSALVCYAAKTYRNQPAFYFPSTEELDPKYECISWEQFHRMTDAVAAKYSTMIHDVLAEAKKSKVQPTIAQLGHATTIQYFATQIALQKLNIRTLFLAPTNSAEAMQSLLKRCQVSVLIVEENFTVPFPVRDILHLNMVQNCLDFIDASTDDMTISRFEDERGAWERPTFILHSSGSTGPQKPIVHTNRSLLTIARMYRPFPDFHIENWFLTSAL